MPQTVGGAGFTPARTPIGAGTPTEKPNFVRPRRHKAGTSSLITAYNYRAMRTVTLAWTLFILAGLFVSLVVPVGEGFDETWHFGYVQYVAQTGKLPPGPLLKLSQEMQTFLQRHPIGWRLRDIFPDLRTQEEYWRAPAFDRSTNDQVLRGLRFSGSYVEGDAGFAQYESHQPPLYYLLTAPLFLVCSRLFSFVDTFFMIRIWSMLLASAVVPLAYALAKRISSSRAIPGCVATLVAMFPGLYPDVARVSNDALAVPLAALVFLSLARYMESKSPRDRLVLAAVLVAGLGTKAFFVPIFAAVIVVVLWLKDYRTAGILAAGAIVGSLWYARNLWVTGSLTGLPETVSANTTVTSSLASLDGIHWFGLLRLAAVSHIWMGYWSLLQYRSWMYDTILVVFAIGLAGFCMHVLRSSPKTIYALLLIYTVFAVSLLYYATQVFQQTGVAVIQGWYLSTMLSIEVIVFVLGVEFLFSRRGLAWIVSFLGTSFLALFIYGNAFIAAPYYTGLTDHAASGHLRAYHPHWNDVTLMTLRLTRLHPWIPNAMPLLLGIAVIALGLSLIWSCYASSR